MLLSRSNNTTCGIDDMKRTKETSDAALKLDDFLLGFFLSFSDQIIWWKTIWTEKTNMKHTFASFIVNTSSFVLWIGRQLILENDIFLIVSAAVYH